MKRKRPSFFFRLGDGFQEYWLKWKGPKNVTYTAVPDGPVKSMPRAEFDRKVRRVYIGGERKNEVGRLD